MALPPAVIKECLLGSHRDTGHCEVLRRRA
jgi:hypothetical protein